MSILFSSSLLSICLLLAFSPFSADATDEDGFLEDRGSVSGPRFLQALFGENLSPPTLPSMSSSTPQALVEEVNFGSTDPFRASAISESLSEEFFSTSLSPFIPQRPSLDASPSLSSLSYASTSSLPQAMRQGEPDSESLPSSDLGTDVDSGERDLSSSHSGKVYGSGKSQFSMSGGKRWASGHSGKISQGGKRWRPSHSGKCPRKSLRKSSPQESSQSLSRAHGRADLNISSSSESDTDEDSGAEESPPFYGGKCPKLRPQEAPQSLSRAHGRADSNIFSSSESDTDSGSDSDSDSDCGSVPLATLLNIQNQQTSFRLSPSRNTGKRPSPLSQRIPRKFQKTSQRRTPRRPFQSPVRQFKVSQKPLYTKAQKQVLKRFAEFREFLWRKGWVQKGSHYRISVIEAYKANVLSLCNEYKNVFSQCLVEGKMTETMARESIRRLFHKYGFPTSSPSEEFISFPVGLDLTLGYEDIDNAQWAVHTWQVKREGEG